jgi:hypothetical protein
MKTKHKMKNVSLFAAALVLLASCEPAENFTDHFDPNPTDTVYTKGANLSFKTGGVTALYSSRGAGIQCLDTATLLTHWAVATGNNLTYDPVWDAWEGGPNDTVVIVAWESVAGGTGTYNFTSPFDAVCYVSTPFWFRTYDPSLLTVNITRTTADSIFGTYSGAIQEIEFQIDPSGNPIFAYTGVIDTVSAVFGVVKGACY